MQEESHSDTHSMLQRCPTMACGVCCHLVAESAASSTKIAHGSVFQMTACTRICVSGRSIKQTAKTTANSPDNDAACSHTKRAAASRRLYVCGAERKTNSAFALQRMRSTVVIKVPVVAKTRAAVVALFSHLFLHKAAATPTSCFIVTATTATLRSGRHERHSPSAVHHHHSAAHQKTSCRVASQSYV